MIIRRFRLSVRGLAAFVSISLFGHVLSVSQALAAPTGQDEKMFAELQHLQASDLRVATITYRLAVGNVELCRDHAPLTGLSLQDAQQYGADFRAAAIRLFHLRNGLNISAVVPSSPADRAGLAAGDTIISINDVRLDPAGAGSATKRAATYDALAQEIADLDHALAAGPVTFGVQRGTHVFEARLAPIFGCASKVQLLPSPDSNAGADGQMISITTAMVDLAANDDELAVLLGHEMAHNVLGHRARLDEQHVARGMLGQFGKNAARIRQTEKEADYLGLYLMARAGYNIDAAPIFWRHYGETHVLASLLADSTHPSWQQRERDLRSAAAEIRAKQQQGQPVVPGLMPFVRP